MNITPVLGDRQIINPPSWSISSEIMSYFLYGFVIYKFKKYAKVFFFIYYNYISVFIVCKRRLL